MWSLDDRYKNKQKSVNYFVFPNKFKTCNGYILEHFCSSYFTHKQRARAHTHTHTRTRTHTQNHRVPFIDTLNYKYCSRCNASDDTIFQWHFQLTTVASKLLCATPSQLWFREGE